MAAPSLTYTLTNGSTADATQVMQNFNDLLNGVTDGTKDLSISALTCAGTATLNGHVNVGNSTSDDLTVTASLASSLPIKTNTTYNIGSSTLGLGGLYIGGTSTFTTKLAGAATASYTITLPVDVPAGNDYVARYSTGGAMTFGHPGPSGASGSDADTSLTLSSARVQVVTPTATRAYTLPTTGVKTGDIWYFTNNAASTTDFLINVKSSGANQVLTIYPGTTNGVVALQDTPTTAAHWMGLGTVSSHWYTDTGFTTSSFLGFGTVTTISVQRKRVGDMLKVRGSFISGTANATTATIILPTFTLDTGKFLTTARVHSFGFGISAQTGGVSASFSGGGNPFALCYDGSNTDRVVMSDVTSGGVMGSRIGGSICQDASGDGVTFNFEVPISGWGPCKG